MRILFAAGGGTGIAAAIGALAHLPGPALTAVTVVTIVLVGGAILLELRREDHRHSETVLALGKARGNGLLDVTDALTVLRGQPYAIGPAQRSSADPLGAVGRSITGPGRQPGAVNSRTPLAQSSHRRRR
jgi:hypothetical protein